MKKIISRINATINPAHLRKAPRIVGRTFMDFAEGIGNATRLTGQTFYWIFRGPIDWKNTITQMVEIGWNSFPVIGLTSLFTGMVLALQTGSSFRNIFNEPVFIGTLVSFSLVEELGPVLASVVIAGRCGASIAAEIGTMKVTEQVDALSTLGTNPVRYLFVPRYLAFLTMVPLLTMLSMIIGILGGLAVSVFKLDIPSSVYWEDIFSYMEISDLMHGLIKTFIFAAIIVSVSCYKGYTCSGGAEGVGKSTTSAVMISMVMVLVSDYFLSAILIALGIG